MFKPQEEGTITDKVESMKVISCTCQSEYQDKLYGKGRRIANKTEKKLGLSPVWRCTVCGKDRT